MVDQIAPQQAADWLESRKDCVLLDVREPWETALVQIEGATHLPMSQLGKRFDELAKDRPTMVLCHHGVRSNAVANALARAGFAEVFNVRGGVEAWACEVDATLARY